MRTRVATLVVLFAAIAGLLSLPLSRVVDAAPGGTTTVGSFEIDGNLVDDTGGGEPIDWETLRTSPRLSIGRDKPTGQTDDSYAQGSKDDTVAPTVETGAIPNNKSDLLRMYVSHRRIGSNDFLYLAWVRAATLGTANFSYELNQKASPPPPPSGTWLKVRTPGDALIQFDFTSGGNRPVLRISRWKTSGQVKTTCEASSKLPCWGKAVTLNSTTAAGAVNDPADPGFTGSFPMSDPLANNADLPRATFGEAAINMQGAGIAPDICVGFSRAEVRSRSSSSFPAELKDFIAPIAIDIRPPADPTGATANGDAWAAGIDGDTTDGTPATPVNHATSTQTGPGSDSNTAGGNLLVPNSDGGPLGPKAGDTADIGVLRTVATSTVSEAGANQRSTAETLSVALFKNRLTGLPLVEADVVRAVATTTATSGSSSYSSAGSTIEGLKVNGEAIENISPNTKIELPAETYGIGSYVAVYELGPAVHKTGGGIGTTSQPAAGQKGAFTAALTVNMLHVVLTDQNPLPGDQGEAAEAFVSRAEAASSFEGLNCAGHEVDAHAFILSENTDPSLAPALVGFVAIPKTGGREAQELNSINLPVLASSTAATLAEGTIFQTSATSNSHATIEDVCVLNNAVTGTCVVAASLLKAATSSTNGVANSNGTTVVASVNGGPLGAQAPNTTIPLDGIGYVTFNEQTCDTSGVLANGCTVSTVANGKTTKTAGLTVRTVHIVITVPNNPTGLAPGIEIIVGESYSSSSLVS